MNIPIRLPKESLTGPVKGAAAIWPKLCRAMMSPVCEPVVDLCFPRNESLYTSDGQKSRAACLRVEIVLVRLHGVEPTH